MKKWEEEQRKKAHMRKVEGAKSTISNKNATSATKPDAASKLRSPWVSNRVTAGDSSAGSFNPAILAQSQSITVPSSHHKSPYAASNQPFTTKGFSEHTVSTGTNVRR